MSQKKAGPSEAPLLPAPSRVKRGPHLRRAFAFLAIGLLALAALHQRGLETEWEKHVLQSDLEEKVGRFQSEAQRLLEASPMAGHLAQSMPNLADVQSLLSDSEKGSAPAVFVHLREENQETILLKGPGLIQKITVAPDRVEIAEGDETAIRRVVVQEGENPPQIRDVDRPVSGLWGPELESESFLAPQYKLEERLARAKSSLRTRTYILMALGLVCLVGLFLYVSLQLQRIQDLQADLDRQRQLAYLGTLAGGLAHEIRNPLNGIGLNLHLLEETLKESEGRLSAQSQRFVGRIRPALDHLERTLEDFLQFARPGEHPITEVDLEALIHQLLDFLEPQAEAKSVRLEEDLEPDLGPFRGQEARLHRVLLNLLKNALDAVDPGGRVEVRLASGGEDTVQIAVRDDGPGFQDLDLEKCFQVFFTTKEDGIGLGLPIVKRVVEDHGGRCEIRLPPWEKGAEVVLILPRGGMS